jgi:hypothetical protein
MALIHKSIENLRNITISVLLVISGLVLRVIYKVLKLKVIRLEKLYLLNKCLLSAKIHYFINNNKINK